MPAALPIMSEISKGTRYRSWGNEKQGSKNIARVTEGSTANKSKLAKFENDLESRKTYLDIFTFVYAFRLRAPYMAIERLLDVMFLC